MTPVERVAALYGENSPRSFKDDLELHLLHGHVVSMPDFFCMAREVEAAAPLELIRNPSVTFPSPDSWFIYAYAGNISGIFKHAPYPLPSVCFDRRVVFRSYSWDVITQRILSEK